MENQLKKFDIYEHPLLPQKILKNGFSWPAFFVGPVWLMFKKIWAFAVVVVVMIAILKYFNQGAEVPFFTSIFCEKELFFYQYNYGYDCVKTIRQWNDFLILLIVNVIVAVNGNEFWARDLINRGYVSKKSIKARSLDDALAIIATSRRGSVQDNPVKNEKVD